MLPYCSTNESLSFTPTGEIAAEHINQNIIIGQPSQIQHICYKLMAFITVLDILNLINACIFAGFFSLFGITHCNSGIFVVYVASWQFGLWFLYSMTCQILSLNRLVIFTNENLTKILFGGKRFLLWVVIAIGYAAALSAAVPDAFYFYNPYEGSYYFLRTSGLPNGVQIYFNFLKMGWVTVAYLILILLMYFYKRSNIGEGKIPNFQFKVTVQTLVIAVLHDLCAMFYMAESYLPLPEAFLRIAGTVGHMAWIYLHSNITSSN
ncbi:hypothetical protein L596_012895 [Steinernema carpocapsae]|uniref:7TM GPCR serpentine receptor class x (Srx) domain-containing protein n=1 Tax=Steinernema carpocapsae TaxID=34508 RepID=A0A4U5NZ81_STECR|nr:hypothetical protein L596_012895 [Steinernema carpocapsae]